MLCPNCQRNFTTNELCSSCMYAQSKGEKKGVTKRYTLPKISDKKKKREAEVQRLKKELLKKYPYCQTCLSTRNLTYSHIIPRGMYPELELHPKNAMIQCLKCHMVYQFGSINEVRSQSTWGYCLEVMKELSEEYYNKQLTRRP